MLYMETLALISFFRQDRTHKSVEAIKEYFAFKPEEQPNQNFSNKGYGISGSLAFFRPKQPSPSHIVRDANIARRAQVVNELLKSFTIDDIILIRALFDEEVRCEMVTWEHDSLHQLCYYLYELGQLEDTFRLYFAKFQIPHMDVGAFLDRELITVRHQPDEVIKYIELAFVQDPELRKEYPKIIEELINLKEDDDFSVTNYTKFIRGYFFGHENVDRLFR
jgi:hypothetical protein